jgi:hypothetical protein
MSNETNHTTAPESEVPALDPPTADGAKPVVARTGDVLDELREFARQFPTPERGCNIADARWFTENFEELVRLYRGQIVVVYNGAVVAHGGDAHRLRLDAARKLNVSPDCLTVELVYAPEL